MVQELNRIFLCETSMFYMAFHPAQPAGLLHVFLSELDLAPRVFSLPHGHLHHVLGQFLLWENIGTPWENHGKIHFKWRFIAGNFLDIKGGCPSNYQIR